MSRPTHPCPPRAELTEAVVLNGRMPGAAKHILDEGWWLVDESPGGGKETISIPSRSTAPARGRTDADPEMLEKLLGMARAEGWSVREEPERATIDLGQKCRARAQILFFEGTERAPSLFVATPGDGETASDAVLSFALHFTSFVSRVRASLLDLGGRVSLAWETPFDPDNPPEDSLSDGLWALAGAIRHGQTAIEWLSRDEPTAEQWLRTHFLQPNQH